MKIYWFKEQIRGTNNCLEIKTSIDEMLPSPQPRGHSIPVQCENILDEQASGPWNSELIMTTYYSSASLSPPPHNSTSCYQSKLILWLSHIRQRHNLQPIFPLLWYFSIQTLTVTIDASLIVFYKLASIVTEKVSFVQNLLLPATTSPWHLCPYLSGFPHHS